MLIQPSLIDLAKFLKSFLNPKQITDFIELLKSDVGTPAPDPHGLDPENTSKPQPVQSQAPQGLAELLNEMEKAYSIENFPPPTQTESQRLNDMFPGLSKRISAFQGRQLVKMLREKLGI